MRSSKKWKFWRVAVQPNLVDRIQACPIGQTAVVSVQMYKNQTFEICVAASRLSAS